MGQGITTENFADPLVEWKARIAYLGAPDVERQVRLLLGGRAIRAEDGVVEVSCADQVKPGHHVISIRIPHAARTADVGVRVLTDADLYPLADRDLRSPVPSPLMWMSPGAGSVASWELFNCVIWSVGSRPN